MHQTYRKFIDAAPPARPAHCLKVGAHQGAALASVEIAGEQREDRKRGLSKP
jgi:hypothetical protein